VPRVNCDDEHYSLSSPAQSPPRLQIFFSFFFGPAPLVIVYFVRTYCLFFMASAKIRTFSLPFWISPFFFLLEDSAIQRRMSLPLIPSPRRVGADFSGRGPFQVHCAKNFLGSLGGYITNSSRPLSFPAF